MEGGNGEDLFSTKAKVEKKKMKIFVHHTAMVGLLFLSQNILFHFYILYTLCSTEPALVWLCVHEIPRPTTESKFFDLNLR